MVRRYREKPGPYMRLCVLIVYPFVSFVFKRRWIHLDRIPNHGPAIVVVNHISYADPLVIARFIWDAGRAPRFMAKAALFTIPLLGRIVAGSGQIPVRRGMLDAAHALQGAVDALDRGEIVLIYPEGTVTRDPAFWPMQAKTGVARLARLAPGVPVIPVGQWGAHKFFDAYAKKLSPLPRKTVTVSAGEPLDLSEFAAGPETAELLRRMTDKVMSAVQAQVASIRGEEPPHEFYGRPGGTAHAIELPHSEHEEPRTPNAMSKDTEENV
jgi:1-acyl-sn-glycerol-3-phosphate acyltransferase